MTACSFCGVAAAPPAARFGGRLDLVAPTCADCATLDQARPGAVLCAAARVAGAAEDSPFFR